MRLIVLGLAASLAACSSQRDEEPSRETEVLDIAPEDVPDSPPAIAYDGPIPRPITVGGQGTDADSCGVIAEVAKLEQGEDGYLSVRDAPNSEVKERDRLDTGQIVQICTASGGWSGVVYATAEDDPADCETAGIAEERNYTGPCSQGWVESRFLEPVSG